MFRIHRSAIRTRPGRLSVLCLVAGCAIAPLRAVAAASPPTAAIQAIVDAAIKTGHVKGIIVQVRCGGQNLYLQAAGESMTGVPVTANMHYRNGAMAFTYMSTMLLELVDKHPELVSLNDKLAKFMPQIRGSENVTMKELANMTSGYQDYVYEPEVTTGLYRNPFRQWTPEELIQIGVTPDRWFDPGKNWAYSHTNYVILGRVLEQITGMSLAQAMQKYIIGPMGLQQTQSIETPQIPEPVMHSFTSERREALHVPTDVPFYEESTYWNPSWTTAEGAVQITDITDMSRSMEVVGLGTLLSPTSYAEQVGPNLVGFGHKQDNCPPCRALTSSFNYGLGIVNIGPWITQTKSFAGSGATVGYLASSRLTISVVTTYTEGAFDEHGDAPNASITVFSDLANLLAPHTLPPR